MTLDLVEPPLSRIERCEVVHGAARLSADVPTVTAGQQVRWFLEPRSQGAGPRSFVAYPRTKYRTSCLIYNGPQGYGHSSFILSVFSKDDNLGFSRAFRSNVWFVATAFSQAQVTAMNPLLGKRQTIFVRVDIMTRDSLTLGLDG